MPPTSPVYSGCSNDTATCDCAARLYTSVGRTCADDPVQARRVAHVAVVQLVDLAGGERALARVVDARAVQLRRAPRDAVHLVALLEQELRQIGAVLPRDSRDQRNLARHLSSPFLCSIGSHSRSPSAMIPAGGARTPALDRRADRRRRGRAAGAALRPERAALRSSSPPKMRTSCSRSARNLALGHGISVSDGTIPSNGVQPLATFLWSACFWIVGGAKKTGVLLVLVAELAIGAASALGLWQLAQRALAGTRQAGLAALLAAAAWWASPVGDPARDERARDRALRGPGDRWSRSPSSSRGRRAPGRSGASSASGSRSDSRSLPATTRCS